MSNKTQISSKKSVKKVPIKTMVSPSLSKKVNLRSGKSPSVSDELQLKMHDLMVKSRVLEERLIKIYKAGDAYFWIGAPGEEAWGTALGLNVNKGQGPEHDYLHLHYRGTPTLIAMGMPVIDSIRLIMNRATDPSTGGRNFSNHYCFPQWNVVPVSSPIEVQYIQALGTAHVQKRTGKNAISIVTGGDAGTAEGDFASSLVWSSRRGQELPILLTVQNNGWGISTSYEGQHGETNIADRAKAFNIRSRVINGNDPIEAYLAIEQEVNYIRDTGKPSFIEARVSRLFGHSSASGANRAEHDFDCVLEFEKKLVKSGLISKKQAQNIWEAYEAECAEAQKQVKSETVPTAESVWENIYVGSENADWRKF